MKFKAEHLFSGITAADYETLYFDEAFNIELCNAVSLDRALVKREVNGKRLTRAVKVSPRGREIPGPVAKVLGASRIEYVEHIDYELGGLRGTWKTVSSLMTDKVLSSGTIEFVPSGSGVTRIVAGDVTVKIFGVGGMIERFIIADVEKSYEAAAQFTRQYLSRAPKS